MRRVLGMVVLLGALAPMAAAGPLRVFGYDSTSVGQANSQGAYGAGVGVLYTNPALLLDLEEQFTVESLFLQPSLEITLMDRPANADIPITFYDSDVGIEGSNLDRPLPTSELPAARQDNRQRSASGYVGIGLVHSLGIEDFRFGLAVLVPTSGIASVGSSYADERDQYFSNTVHFVRFGQWSQQLSLLVGAAYRPLPWLSVGACAESSLAAVLNLNAFIPEATVQDYAVANGSLGSTFSSRGIVGINVRALEPFSFSLVWRDRRYFSTRADVILNLWNYHEAGNATVPKRVRQHHLLAFDYEPMEITLTAGADLGTLKLEANTTWNHWADYLDPHHQRAQQTAMFEDPNNPGPLVGDGARFEFSDTFSFALASAWTYLEGLTLTAGLAYHPSPVPPQVGRTSYADSDLLCAALGHRFDFKIQERSLRVDLGLQVWRLFEQTVHKDASLIKDEFADRAKTLIGGRPMPEAAGLQTNNPGFPGYTVAGLAFVGALSLTYLF